MEPVDGKGEKAPGWEGQVLLWTGRSPYVAVRKMYAATRLNGRHIPVMDLEAHYEATNHSFEVGRVLWTARDIRLGGWQSIMSGACGYTYGCNSIWQMHNGESKTHPPIEPPTTAYTNWYLELDLPGAYQAAIIRNVVLSLPNPSLRIPDQSIILSDTHEPKDDKWAEDKLVCAMRGQGWFMVHLPYGGEVVVDLQKGGIEGAWRAWWVDPRSGGRELVQRSAHVGEKAFKAPSEGWLNGDWLLLVEHDVWL